MPPMNSAEPPNASGDARSHPEVDHESPESPKPPLGGATAGSGAGLDHAAAPFETVGDGIYSASLPVSVPQNGLERLRRLFLGQPIPERLASRERLNRARALATLSSDALSSVAYGTEASLAVLIAAGIIALASNLGIGLATAALMLIVGYSYRQTIHAYPSGGGSYIVARANLGVLAGLVAAAALLIDYLLTVSVSVASGIDAIASAFPVISPARLAIELGAIALITLLNLRGLRASGTIFAIPTYFFLISFGLMLVVGVVQALLHGGLAHAVPPQPLVGGVVGTEPLTLLLILTAFASGCSAMTGVEAISNGVPAFKGATPVQQSRHAAQTLLIMICLLVTFFVGTTYLAWRVGAIAYPSGNPTVTSQIARFAFPEGSVPLGWLFYVVQAATLLILVFAANTSFADFPRLAAILAHDSFMPALFAYRGERISFSVGITALGVLSAVVLAVMRGNVVALINLYALGVFCAFTLSQSGMVIHWLRRRNERGWQGRIIANGVGATATAIVTVVIGITKFDRGAWVVVILIPLLVLSFLGIRAYYRRPRIIRMDMMTPPEQTQADVVFVPIFSHQGIVQSPENGHPQDNWPNWPSVMRQELAYAARIAPDIRLIRVVGDQKDAERFSREWSTWVRSNDPELQSQIHTEAVISPYRTIVLPVANFLRWRQDHDLQGKRIALLVPRELHPSWWEWPLQRWIARRVHHLVQQQDSHVQLIDLPYVLGKWH